MLPLIGLSHGRIHWHCRSNIDIASINKPGRTADQIIADCSNYKSQNCFAVAHADYDFNYFSEHTSLKGEFIGTVGATAPRIASTAEFPVLNDVGEFNLSVHRDGVDDPIPLIQATDFLLYPDEGIIVFDNGMRMTTDTRHHQMDDLCSSQGMNLL